MAAVNENTAVEHVPIVIIGGGIGGLMLGAVLKRLGIEYAILERTSVPTPQGAGISLAPNCLPALEQLGIPEKVKDSSQDLLGIRIYRNEKLWGTWNCGLAKKWFGRNVLSVERHTFHHQLYEAADGDATLQLQWNVVDIVDNPDVPYVVVKGSNGKEIRGDVVVGADGIRSVTRRILARNSNGDKSAANTIAFTGRVHMSGYTAPLEHVDKNDRGVGHFILHDDRIFTTYPCADNRQWFIGVKKADLAPGDTPDRSVWKNATKALVNDTYGDLYHPFGANERVDSIVNESERVIASNVFAETEFPSMVHRRVALLGDAAHAMTSFFGQGACQAIEDAVELGNALSDRYSGDESALSNYASNREERARQVATFSGQYAALHTARLPWGLGPFTRYVVYNYVPDSAFMWYLRWLWGYQPTIKQQGAKSRTESPEPRKSSSIWRHAAAALTSVDGRMWPWTSLR